ncbi:winged helix-turn-helix transcriptional regulator [Frankia sp. AgB1.9]|uniref:MarR family winged helix-turn-helix transcriptional regulator n=1 Tax=unclassified Frankia TaxID=2632575 RepID=UPI00193160B8|nr:MULTISPECIES: MarR family winged helix-turn-helix transcriptional regulator [unclassified Frankia]MBL7491427.1 winged helix-turn-helix transcriptional regulator [Frankia sp. AgW1.1]MBL7553776.1 winged helix-turn-helix transcriptional regulator [Frankia sp. AgB1.9]MBL7620963.1 winged helix-turn-helix transcriptional regulator [Frankia sp. AgB1.8]
MRMQLLPPTGGDGEQPGDWAGLDGVLRRAGAALDGPPELVALWMYVARAGRALRALSEPGLAAVGIDTSDFAILAALWFRGEPFRASPGALALDVGLSQSGTARALQRLEVRAAIRRHGHPADRRATIVELTGAGAALVHRQLAEISGTFAACLDAPDGTPEGEAVDLRLVAAAFAAFADRVERAVRAKTVPTLPEPTTTQTH